MSSHGVDGPRRASIIYVAGDLQLLNVLFSGERDCPGADSGQSSHTNTFATGEATAEAAARSEREITAVPIVCCIATIAHMEPSLNQLPSIIHLLVVLSNFSLLSGRNGQKMCPDSTSGVLYAVRASPGMEGHGPGDIARVCPQEVKGCACGFCMSVYLSRYWTQGIAPVRVNSWWVVSRLPSGTMRTGANTPPSYAAVTIFTRIRIPARSAKKYVPGDSAYAR